MNIKTICDQRKALRNGPYAWPGGYPLFFVMNDGGAMSVQAVRDNLRNVLEAIQSNDRCGGWLPVAFEINWEDASLYCGHTGERIPSAYADEELSS